MQKLSSFSSSLIFGIAITTILNSFTCDETLYFWTNTCSLSLELFVLSWRMNFFITAFTEDPTIQELFLTVPACSIHFLCHLFAKCLQLQSLPFSLKAIMDFQVWQDSCMRQCSTSRSLRSGSHGDLQGVQLYWVLSMPWFIILFQQNYVWLFLYRQLLALQWRVLYQWEECLSSSSYKNCTRSLWQLLDSGYPHPAVFSSCSVSLPHRNSLSSWTPLQCYVLFTFSSALCATQIRDQVYASS